MPPPVSARAFARGAAIVASAVCWAAPAIAQPDRDQSATAIASNRLVEWFGPSNLNRPARGLPPLFASEGGMEAERTAVRATAEAYWRPAIAPASAWLAGDLADYAADRIVPELFSRAAKRTGYAWPVERYFGGFIPYAIGLPMSGPPPQSHGVWLGTLEAFIGWPTLQALLRSLHEQGTQTPLSADEFVRMADALTGRELGWFLRQVADRHRVFDYGIDRLRVSAMGANRYRSIVGVRRYGEGVFTVDVETQFAGGASVIERWDGRGPRETFVYESAAPALSAAVDPRDTLRLDRRRANNRRTVDRQPIRQLSLPWSAQWLTWLQDCLLSFAVLA